jgi:hypothetical protein
VKARLAESKAQTQELMVKTKELQSEGNRLTMQKQLSEKMRERFTLTNKVGLQSYTPSPPPHNSMTNWEPMASYLEIKRKQINVLHFNRTY